MYLVENYLCTITITFVYIIKENVNVTIKEAATWKGF
jgi:hypothetical protein